MTITVNKPDTGHLALFTWQSTWTFTCVYHCLLTSQYI